MTELPKSERLMNLAAFFLSAAGEVPVSRIIEEVDGYRDENARQDAREKRFRRDRAELEALGLRIMYRAGAGDGDEGGYRLLREETLLPRIAFSHEERCLLTVLLNGDAAQSEALRSARAKLQVDHPLDEAPPQALALPDRDRPQPAALVPLGQALQERRVACFSYQALHAAQPTPRQVEIYGLGYRRGTWYVVGLDRVVDAIRTFHVGRIMGAVSCDQESLAYEIPAGFDLREYLERPRWRFNAAGTDVILESDEEFAWLLERELGDTARGTDAQGAVRRFTLPGADAEAVIRLVRGFLGRVRLVAPESLRRELARRLDQERARYTPETS